jgi:hypothetical protein
MSFERNPEDLDRDALERLLGGDPTHNRAFTDPFEGAGDPLQDAGLGTVDTTPAPQTPAPSTTPDPPNSTMPVGGQPRVQPAATTGAFQGQGQGWRGLDINPLGNRSSVTPLHGFNLNRAYDAGDPNSVKDTFARWATGIQTPLAGLDHAGVQNVIQQNLERARQMGLNIMDVQGDRILIDAAEHGPMWVDVVENAGGDPTRGEIPAWAWQVQGDPHAPENASGGGGGGRASAPQLSPMAPPEMPLTGGGDQQSAMDEIIAEIEALMSGQGSPMDARALQGLLR